LHIISLADGASEGKVRLDEDGENVILDAIHVLTSRHSHLSAVQQEGEDDAMSDNADKFRNIVKGRSKAMAEVSYFSYLFLCLS
jgi:hypothetical protein